MKGGKNKMKNNKGITLIALVVTIIVLLILAAVSIAMLTGDNGILGRGQQASTQTAVTNARDQVAMKVAECVTEYFAVSYAGANNTTYNSSADVNTIDKYILSELKKIEGDLKDVNVTIGGTALASATATSGVVRIESKNDSNVYSTSTWSTGGKFTTWTNHLGE